MKKEVYFHGEISHGYNFDLDEEGLCVEMLVLKHETWKAMNSEES